MASFVLRKSHKRLLFRLVRRHPGEQIQQFGLTTIFVVPTIGIPPNLVRDFQSELVMEAEIMK